MLYIVSMQVHSEMSRSKCLTLHIDLVNDIKPVVSTRLKQVHIGLFLF